MIDAVALGFELVTDEESALAAFAHAFMKAAGPQLDAQNSNFDHDQRLPFVHFMWRTATSTTTLERVLKIPRGPGRARLVRLHFVHAQARGATPTAAQHAK